MNAHHKKTHKISLSSQSSTKAHTTTTRKIGTIECSGVQVEGNDEDEGYGGNVTKGPFQTRRALFSSLNARPFGAKVNTFKLGLLQSVRVGYLRWLSMILVDRD